MSYKLFFKDMITPPDSSFKLRRPECTDDCESCRDCDYAGAAEENRMKSYRTAARSGYIRYAYREDVKAIREIYNYEVLNGVATFDEQPRSLEDRMKWFEDHQDEHHPLIVAAYDGIVIGYASLSPYRPKDAYKSTVELSVYVHELYRGKGVATALMATILAYAQRDETLHNVVSVITSGNEASAKLHDRFGFTFSGCMPDVGLKFGKYLGIDNYYLIV